LPSSQNSVVQLKLPLEFAASAVFPFPFPAPRIAKPRLGFRPPNSSPSSCLHRAPPPTMASPSHQRPPDSAGPAPASIRARLYNLAGGKLMLIAELEQRSDAPQGDGVVLDAEAPAAGARARDKLLLVMLQEERVLHASYLRFVEGSPPAGQEERNKEGEVARDCQVSTKDEQDCPVSIKEDLHLYSIKLRIWPRSHIVHLLLFNTQSWLLTRQYDICCLSNDEVELLTRAIKEDFQKDQTTFFALLRFNFEGIMVHLPRVSLFAESELRPSINDFQIRQFLGKGASCNAHLGNYCYDHNDYALKVMKLKKRVQEEPREVSIQSCLRSPYIVRFSQAWIGSLCNLKYEDCSDSYSSESISPRTGYSANVSEFYPYVSSTRTESSSTETCSNSKSYGRSSEGNSVHNHSDSSKGLVCFEDGPVDTQCPKCMCISMEFCPRTLGEYLMYGSHKCDVEKSMIIFQEVTTGLKHMHDVGIVHRDLKPSNIFFGMDGGIKIADFGHSCFQPDPATSFDGTPKRGTLFYAALELDTGVNTSEKVDIYSLGVIYLQLFHSFGTATEMLSKFKRYCRGVGSQVEWEGGDLALFRKMVSEDPRERPSATDILDYISKGPSSS
ncbi:hypothetical protein EJB05_37285, partial [Eragrostis curvula]